MKKLIILFIPFLLTGCFGLKGQGYLTNTCTKIEKTVNIEENDTYILDFKSGIVNKVTLTKSYSSTDDISYIKDSLNSYKAAYENDRGVNITINDYTITYEFDMSLVKDEIKKTFDLKDNYNDQIKVLKEKGVVCK